MAGYALLLLVDIPQMHLWSKFEGPIPCEYLATELNTTGEYFAHAHKCACFQMHTKGIA